MQKADGKYLVRFNALSRNLLISALSTCRFTMLHYDHPFAVIIRQHQLIDADHLQLLFGKIKNAENTEMMEFTLEDEILIYTAMDITCKFFLTELSDDLKRINQDIIKHTGENFESVRSTLLHGVQFVRDGMRSTLWENESFRDRVELLDMVLNIE